MNRIVIAALSVTSLSSQVAPMAFQPPSWGPGMPRIEGAQSGPVTGIPISGKEVRRTTQTLNDGTLVDHSDISYFYRDAFGRMRAESPNRVEIFDPVSHVEFDMDPRKKVYRRLPLPNNPAYISVAVVGGTSATSVSSDTGGNTHHAASSASGSTTEDLGRETVNGLLAKGTRVTVTIPVGAFGNNREVKVVNERWFSEELQTLVKSSNNDPRFGLNVYELTNIDRTPPNPALFEPPSDYTLVSRER